VKKTESTITFRLDAMMADEWESALKATGVNDSVLVRACIQAGFKEAVRRLIADRKRGEAALFAGRSTRVGCGLHFAAVS